MTNIVTFTGKILWPRNLFIPDEFRGQSNYKLNLIVDDENLKKFEESGIRTKTKETSEGETFILLKRASEPKVFPDGNTIGGGAPKIFDKDGTPWDKDKPLGNGTVVEAVVTTYKGGDFVGHRLESITILEYVPYVNTEARENAEEPSAADKPVKKGIPF